MLAGGRHWRASKYTEAAVADFSPCPTLQASSSGAPRTMRDYQELTKKSRGRGRQEDEGEGEWQMGWLRGETSWAVAEQMSIIVYGRPAAAGGCG